MGVNTCLGLQWKVAPALAAGNTAVLKPSEVASVTCLELAAIAQEVKALCLRLISILDMTAAPNFVALLLMALHLDITGYDCH